MKATNQKKMDKDDEFVGEARVRKVRLSPADIALAQQPFLKKLAQKMADNGHSIEDVANALDVPYSYVVAIKNGVRRVVNSDESTIEKFATYLDVPLIQIYIWGGKFKAVDFVAKRTLVDGINQAFDRMSNDPFMTTIVPSAMDWNNSRKWSQDAKLAFTRLYEALAGELFLKHANVELDGDGEKLFLNYIKKF